jgi:2-polyprenyl-6-methoxyphenol hydroxylase-like FAD-dependent oxidoreductase
MTASSTDILIIGAGPTGFMLACQLSLYPNLSFRIIDKNASRTTESRAIGVHARSLELFEQLHLAEEAIAQGQFATKMNAFFRGKQRFSLDLSLLRKDQHPLLTHYPSVLILQQSITERMLETFLNEHNVQVQRNAEVIDLIDSDSIDGTGVEVILSTGEIIRTKYVCACDGARSIYCST